MVQNRGMGTLRLLRNLPGGGSIETHRMKALEGRLEDFCSLAFAAGGTPPP
jgi:hypothetical protein